MEKLLAMPRIAVETVELAAQNATEQVAELLAVNEQRLLAHPTILSKIRVRIEAINGEELAWLYVLDAYEGGVPSARYLGIMADAAEAAGAPEDYVRDLRGRPCRSVGP
jgi:hypothetical protein